MTVVTGVLIDGPAPSPPAFTLTGAAQVEDLPGDNDHALMGVAVRSYPCGPAHVWDWLNHTGNKVTLTSTPNPTFRGFTVYLREECNTRGLSGAAYADRVKTLFPAVENYAVEREFWTGEILNAVGNPTPTPVLASEIPVPGGADSTMFPTASTAQTAVEGLALLEAAIATTGRQGMIHASPSLVTEWMARGGGNLISPDRGNPPKLRTQLGTIVVPGYGYQTAAGVFNGSTPIPPAGHAVPTGHQEWAFATGPVEIRRTPDIEMIPEATDDAIWQAMDRVNNLLAYEAARHYVFDWDACFKAAVLIDRAT